jgi:cytochrome c oxidase assembly protein subunit 15
VSSLQLGPGRFLLLCRITLVVLLANIVTGAAVRLSDSGLGCPDWPNCTRQQLTPPLSLHPVVEFGNRLVVFLLVVTCLVTAVASLLRRPARRDLRWLSGGLLVGVVGEAVLGAVVVYTKLNAYVVVTHFMVGIALLTVGVVLTLRAGHAAGRGMLEVSRGALALTRVLLVMLVAVLVAGASTTGAGPHAGGKGAKRIPIGLEDMTRIHAEVVIASVLVLLALMWVLWRTNAPAVNQDAARILLVVVAVQGFVGYVQFFTHLPALLVGIHVFGAAMVWSTALWFHHGLSSHLPEVAPPPPGMPGERGGERVLAHAGGPGREHLDQPHGAVPEPETGPA